MLLVNKQGIYYYAPNKEFYSNNTFYEAPSTSQQHIELNKDSKEIKDDFFTYIQHWRNRSITTQFGTSESIHSVVKMARKWP